MSEGECPSQLRTQNKNTNNRRTLPHFTNICEFNLPILQRTVPCAQNAKNRQLS